MATITAASIIAKAQTILQDTTGIRWPDPELLGWLNDGQREVVLYKPNASIKNTTMTTVAGSKQSIPADGVSLIDVVRNMGNGSTPGSAIRITMREVLDSQIPNWHASSNQNATAKHYMYSPLDPRNFYLYPPSTGGVGIDIIYAASPADVASTSNTITLDDIYQTVLLDYLLYRAYSKDTEFAADQNRASTHQKAYLAALTGKAQVETGTNPNTMAPANPNVTPNSR